MPLAGGAADKFGNRYEHWWTVSQFVQMLHGKAETIRIEDPGVAKAEFVLTKAGKRELHQAKRSHPDGKWSLSSLSAGDTQLLQSIFAQLSGNNARFIFVSSSDARELTELAERALYAESVQEFETRFVGTKKEATAFAKLRKIWNDTDAATAYDVLRRVEVRTMDERSLEEQVRFGLSALFLADPDMVAQALWKIADDSIHKTVTRGELIANLERQGFKLRRLTNSAAAPALITQVTDRYLDGARKKLIRKTIIPRSATQTLLKRLQENKASDSVLTGTAGGGKTGCIIELVDELRNRKVPVAVLAFRLDRLKPVSNTAELGQQLGLEESPALVLAAGAEGGEAVLIVDQLDAVSTASGRNSDFFDAVEGLLNEARGLRDRVNLHVIVVCREFDWQNDHRLRRLLSDQHTKIEVGEFSPDEVKRVLEDEKFRPALFQRGQLELLRLPQNLSLFLEAGFDPAKRPEFNTAKELFDRYWDEKSRAVARRAAPASDQWGQVIEVLTEEMTRTQQLSVPRGKLDRFSVDYLQQMASEGVLTFDGERYGFGHESFFDYCFARRFVASERSLCDFLASAEQHLFHRAQVRQVLAYLRDANKPRYISELHGLLHDSRIRAHVKDLALAFLTSVPDPSDDEWKLLEPWLNSQLSAITAGHPNSDRFATLAWNRFFVSQSWFDAADHRGLVAEWMASAALANTATDYLRIHQRHAGDRIADLLEPCVAADQEWPRRIQHIMQWAELENSRKFFELFLRLIDNGTLDNARGPIAVNSTFWSMLHGLAQERPAWIAEVIAHWLRRRRQLLVIAAGEQGKVDWRELFGHDQFGARHFHESASAAPESFVEHVLPVVLEISDAAIYQGDHNAPRRDAVWLLFFPSQYEDSDHACLTSLISALQAAAKSAPGRLKGAISELRKRNSYVSNALLLNIYAAAPQVFAEEAASTLVAEPWRFHCGFSDSPYWTAMQLITQICPFLSPETREQLEAVILDYSGDYEHTPEGYKLRGRSSFALLSAIPPAFRSKAAASRYQELERKFQSPYGAPTGIRVGTVTSPIERSAAEKMSDEQWLKAMKKYDSEYSHPPGEFLKGGAWELAGMFRDFVTNEPERFARLCLKLAPDINPAYLDRALDALKEASVPTELKFELCRKAFAEHPGECAREIANLLASIEQSLPNDLVNMLTCLATEHADPDKELWNEKASGGTAYYGGDILTHGINTTRGRAAEAIRDLIFSDKTYIARFATALPKLVQDRSLSVRACVASTLIAVAQTDWSLAIRLFKNLVQPQEKWLSRLTNLRERIPYTFGIRRVARWVDKLLSKHLMHDDRLLGTQYVDRFIYYGVRDHFSELRPVVERMLRSQHPHVREAGARLSSVAALLHSESALVKEALNGDALQRLGVAKVASSNIASRPSRCWCTAQLIKLFNDQDPDVCREAASGFRTLKDEPFEEYGGLIDAFADSKAYESDSSSILFALEESPEKLPGVTATICERFLSRFADEARDVRTSRSADVHMVSKLVFRTYHQHETDEWGSKCLDLIDQMCLAGIQEVSRGLADFER
jgi:hypothetical protein